MPKKAKIGMTLVAGHRQPLHDTAPDFENDRNVVDLLAALAAQIDDVRRLFDSEPEIASAKTEPGNIVFVDDLAHCMECSWARLEAAAGSQLTPDVVAQCSRLLEASLQVLQQVQRLQTNDDHPSRDI